MITHLPKKISLAIVSCCDKLIVIINITFEIRKEKAFIEREKVYTSKVRDK